MAKTTPTSIRFDEERLQLVMNQEKIQSPQKVVNFLLEEYWIRHKALEIVQGPLSATFMPPVDQVSATATPGDGLSALSTLDKYKKEISETTWSGDLQKVMKRIKLDSGLAGWMVKQLESLADTHRINFTN